MPTTWLEAARLPGCQVLVKFCNSGKYISFVVCQEDVEAGLYVASGFHPLEPRLRLFSFLGRMFR